MSVEKPDKRPGPPSPENQGETPRESLSADPSVERAKRIKGANNKVEGATARASATSPEKKEVARIYNLAFESTKEFLGNKAAGVTQRLKDAMKEQNDNSFDKTLNSMFLAGGLFGKTVRDAENAEIAQLMKTYDRCVYQIDMLMTIGENNPRQLERLKKFRMEIGLPELPPTAVANNEEQQRLAQKTRDAGYKIHDVDYAEINAALARSETSLNAWETALEAIDTGVGIAAGFVPYGNEVYELSKQLTYVSTGTKTPEQAAKDFSFNVIAGYTGGKVVGKLKIGKLAEKYGAIFAKKFSKEFAKKAIPVITKLTGQAAEGAGRGAVSGAVESTLHSVDKGKSADEILNDAIASAERGAKIGAIMGPVGAFLQKRLAMRNNIQTVEQSAPLTKEDILRIPDTPDGRTIRVAVAQELLELPSIDGRQSQALLDAHDVKMSGDSYSKIELAQKMRILEAGGFSRNQADTLLRMGVCGTAQRVGPLPPPPPRPSTNPVAPSAPRKIPPPPASQSNTVGQKSTNTPSTAPAATNILPKPPAPPSKWKTGERIAGQPILASGKTLPANLDYVVQGIKPNDPSIMILKITNGDNPGRLVEVGVADLNKVPKTKAPPPVPRKSADVQSNANLKEGDIVRIDTAATSQGGSTIPVGTYQMENIKDPKTGNILLTLKPLNPTDRGANYSFDPNTVKPRKLSEADAKDRASIGYRETPPPSLEKKGAATKPKNVPPPAPTQPSPVPVELPVTRQKIEADLQKHLKEATLTQSEVDALLDDLSSGSTPKQVKSFMDFFVTENARRKINRLTPREQIAVMQKEGPMPSQKIINKNRVDSAIKALKDRSVSATEQDVRDVIESVVSDCKQGILKQQQKYRTSYGLQKLEADEQILDLKAEICIGQCGPATEFVTRKLNGLGITNLTVVPHQAKKIFNMSENFGHGFAYVSFELNGQKVRYLVDPTQRQFFENINGQMNPVGAKLNSTNKAYADELLQNGFIRLTPDVEQWYVNGMRANETSPTKPYSSPDLSKPTISKEELEKDRKL